MPRADNTIREVVETPGHRIKRLYYAWLKTKREKKAAIAAHRKSTDELVMALRSNTGYAITKTQLLTRQHVFVGRHEVGPSEYDTCYVRRRDRFDDQQRRAEEREKKAKRRR